MKVSRMRRVSARQEERTRKLPRFKFGLCTWCGSWGELVPDHVIDRSLLPGPNVDHRDNIVPACRKCNGKRNDGYTPEWWKLPKRSQRFVIEQKGEVYARRYFTKVPDPLPEELSEVVR